MLGRERARAVIEARPFTRWEQVRHPPDFDDQAVRDLRKGALHIKSFVSPRWRVAQGLISGMSVVIPSSGGRTVQIKNERYAETQEECEL